MKKKKLTLGRQLLRLFRDFVFLVKHPREGFLMAKLRRQGLTYCGPVKLRNLFHAMQSVAQRVVPGIYVEAGCALGGSAIFIARHKFPQTDFHIYDTFSMIPAPGIRDGGDAHSRYEIIKSGQAVGPKGKKYYGYENNLKSMVIGNMRSFGLDTVKDSIHLHEGLFEDTLHIDQPVALAHLDCDWHDSVSLCLERLAPQMSPGGLIVVDDYRSYSGCRVAVDAFLSSHPEFNVVRRQGSLTMEKRFVNTGLDKFHCAEQGGPQWLNRASSAVDLWIDANLYEAQKKIKIADFGCGDKKLHEVLSEKIRGEFSYLGFDLHPQSSDVIKMDLTREQPQDSFDVVFGLGVLEYLDDWNFILSTAANSAPEAVFSFAARELFGGKMDGRLKKGWLSHRTIAETEAEFERYFTILKRQVLVGAKAGLWSLKSKRNS